MELKIEARNLTKIFSSKSGRTNGLLEQGATKDRILEETGDIIAINDISFSVQTGEIFVIMGLSGCGKSTVLRCLNYLVQPTSGTVIIDGKALNNMTAKELRILRQEKIAMVFQQFALLPHRTVLQNSAFGLEVRGIPSQDWEKRAKRNLELVGLAGWENAYPEDLSGGMKQRVGLARALTNDSDILLMDEAFSALDPLIREELQDELLKIQRDMKKTIVFVTHDFNEAVKIADRIGFMKDGVLVQVDSPKEIIRNPVNDYVAKFVKGLTAKGEESNVPPSVR